MQETYVTRNSLDDVKKHKLSELVNPRFPENTFWSGVILNSVNTAINKATLEPLLEGKAISN